MSEPIIESGVVARALADEFPDLRLASVVVDATARPSTAGLRERLALLSNRFGGAQAIALRREEVPHAYRVFFRHVGLDPETTRTPVEAAAIDRLVDGGFLSRNLISDACLVAVVETGVPVWALDESTLRGPLILRAAEPGERVGEGEYAHEAPAGRLLVADERGVVAVLFADPVSERVPSHSTTCVRLVCVAVPGVSDMHVQEALWIAAEAITED